MLTLTYSGTTPFQHECEDLDDAMGTVRADWPQAFFRLDGNRIFAWKTRAVQRSEEPIAVIENR